MDKTVEAEEKSVDKILNVLRERYAKTDIEKCNDVLDKISKFNVDRDESSEKYWDR